jgi:hypothetical protein
MPIGLWLARTIRITIRVLRRPINRAKFTRFRATAVIIRTQKAITFNVFLWKMLFTPYSFKGFSINAPRIITKFLLHITPHLPMQLQSLFSCKFHSSTSLSGNAKISEIGATR